MDSERLINLIRSKECVWNTSCNLYHSRDEQRKAWKYIAAEMKSSDLEVKKKWKNLRDVFRRELKKALFDTGDPLKDNYNPKWPFYDSMCFLKDSITKRETISGSVDDDDTDNLFECDSLVVSSPYCDQQPSKRIKREEENCKDDESQANETEGRTKYLTDNMHDSETMFLMSLLPFLRNVPPSRQLAVRTNLLQVFVNEQNFL